MSERVEVDGELVAETDGAYCFDVGEEEDVWVPKSLCDLDDDEGSFMVEEWFAMKRGLI